MSLFSHLQSRLAGPIASDEAWEVREACEVALLFAAGLAKTWKGSASSTRTRSMPWMPSVASKLFDALVGARHLLNLPDNLPKISRAAEDSSIRGAQKAFVSDAESRCIA